MVKLKLTLFYGCLLTLCIFSVLGSAFAKEDNAPLTIVTEIAPPLQFLNGDELDGSTTQKVRQVLDAANLEAQFKIYPWARAYNLAKRQTNTLIYPLVRTPERESQFHWIGKLLTFQMSVIRIKKDSAQQLTDFNQAKSLKLGIMRDDYAHLIVKQAGFNEIEHYQLSSGFPLLLDLLYEGKIDAMLADLPLLKITAISKGYDPEQLISVFELPDKKVDVFLAAGKNTDKKYVDTLSKTLQQLNTKK